MILDLKRRISEIESQVDLVQIKNDADYYDADIGQSRTLNIEKQVEREFKKRSAPAKKEVSDLRKQEKTMLDALKSSSHKITIKMAEYISIRDAKDRERKEAVHEQDIKDAKVEAFKMIEDGVEPEVANLVVEQTKECEFDLSPQEELRGRTTIGSTYKIELIPGEDDLLYKTKDLLLPTTVAMQKALVSKIKALVKATGVTDIKGVRVTLIPSSKRKDFK